MDSCTLCDYKSKKKSHVTIHLSYKHDVGVTWHPCTLCDYKAKEESVLTRHLRSQHFSVYCQRKKSRRRGCERHSSRPGGLSGHRATPFHRWAIETGTPDRLHVRPGVRRQKLLSHRYSRTRVGRTSSSKLMNISTVLATRARTVREYPVTPSVWPTCRPRSHSSFYV